MPEDGRGQRETPRPSPRSPQPEQTEATASEQQVLPPQASTGSEAAFAQAANSFLEEQAKKLRMQPITLAFRSSGERSRLSGCTCADYKAACCCRSWPDPCFFLISSMACSSSCSIRLMHACLRPDRQHSTAGCHMSAWHTDFSSCCFGMRINITPHGKQHPLDTNGAHSLAYDRQAVALCS